MLLLNYILSSPDSGKLQLQYSLSDAEADILSIVMRIELSLDLITGSGLLAFGARPKREVEFYQGESGFLVD